MRAAFLIIPAALLLGCSTGSAKSGVPRKAAEASKSSTACGDILATLGRKPAGARFTGCQSFPDRQGAPVSATYDVAGQDAVEVEASLIQSSGLSPLKRSCCQWDAAPAGFTDNHGGQYTITMVSEETPVTQRSEWYRIGRFRITIEMITDEI